MRKALEDRLQRSVSERSRTLSLLVQVINVDPRLARCKFSHAVLTQGAKCFVNNPSRPPMKNAVKEKNGFGEHS